MPLALQEIEIPLDVEVPSVAPSARAHRAFVPKSEQSWAKAAIAPAIAVGAVAGFALAARAGAKAQLALAAVAGAAGVAALLVSARSEKVSEGSKAVAMQQLKGLGAIGPAHRKVSGMPTPLGFGYSVPNPASGLPALTIDGMNIAAGGAGLPGTPQAEKYLAQHKAYASQLQSNFAARRKTLPSDASPHYPDRYTKGLYPLPVWVFRDPKSLTLDLITQYSHVGLVDEFGRMKSGHLGFGGGIGDSFARLLSNPLAQATLAIVAMGVGGPAGLAAYGAVQAYVVRGEELTLESAALTAARSAAVSQCGPACGAAFDVGVGIASGDSVDVAAEKAALGAMSPEERAYFEQGKQATKDAGLA